MSLLSQRNLDKLTAHVSHPCFVRYLETVTSTNDLAMTALHENNDSPIAIVSSQQSKGRGRLGRRWHSSHPGNLYLSIGFRLKQTPEKMQSFTIWLALHICQMLQNRYRINTQVKWPNDLLIKGKKIAGFLCEAKIEKKYVNKYVVGLGLNVNCKIAELPKELQAIAETMQNVLGKAIDLNPLTIDLVQTTLTAYHDFLNTDIENALLHNWNMLSATHNKTVKINTGNAVITGTAMGINTKGNLNVRQEDGKIINVNVGDVIN